MCLFCDGCSGHNRNAHIVHTLCYWLTNESPEFISEIQVAFPVRGHSFLPADRAFGRAEKVLKKNAVLTTREDYVKLYNEIGVVNELGTIGQFIILKTWVMSILKLKA